MKPLDVSILISFEQLFIESGEETVQDQYTWEPMKTH